MKRLLILIPAVTLYALLIPSLAHYLSKEHRRVDITFPPSSKVMKAVSLDQTLLMGQYMVIKVITFFGGRSAEEGKSLDRSDFFVMYRNLDVATRLDPYNIDAYYFAQATLTWEVKEYQAANMLLEYGMQYRTWDFYLPFYIAFNYSHFLNDPLNASKYYRKAAELTGNDLFMRLASRKLYEAGRTTEAIAYLKLMIDTTRNEALRRMLKKRLDAFSSVRLIEMARDVYRKNTGVLPDSIDTLRAEGLLSDVLNDPYGGEFYLAADGKVLSTSKFSEAVPPKQPSSTAPIYGIAPPHGIH